MSLQEKDGMMFGTHKKELIGTIALVFAALFWGIEFVVEKDILNHYGANWSNAIRFFVAGSFFLIVFNSSFRRATLENWKDGLISGSAMGFGYAFQTMGLKYVGAGVNAFISSGYIVMIPVFLWIMGSGKPSRRVYISVLTAMVGVGFLSSSDFQLSELALGKGETLTLFGAAFYALGIVLSEKYARKMDVQLLAGIQCIGTFLVSIIMALLLEPAPDYINRIIVLEFVYLIIFASMLTQILFTYGMQYVSSSKAGVIFLLEAISAMILGWLFLQDTIAVTHILGGIIIIISISIQSTNATTE